MAQVVQAALTEPLKSIFSPTASFTSLHNALSRLQSSGTGISKEHSTLTEVHSNSQASEATLQLLSEVCSRGHASFVADYVGEICADPNLTSTDVRHIATMNGDCVQLWLVQNTASLINELKGVTSVAGNIIANPGLVAKLSTQVSGLKTVNDALASVAVPHGGIPADHITQFQQLLSALNWMTTKGTVCGMMPDVSQLQQASKRRKTALQNAALEDDSSLSLIARGLPQDSQSITRYPFHHMMECLNLVFLSDPHELDNSPLLKKSRAHLVLYYFWDTGIQCEWKGLAEALGISYQTAVWWHAISSLERLLGEGHQHIRQGCGSGKRLLKAVLELSLCQDVKILIYAAQLLVSLGRNDLAMRLAQQCCHAKLPDQDNMIVVFERLVLVLLDLNDPHGALQQIRRYANGEWSQDLNNLLFFLGNWAMEDDEKKRSFLELPFSRQEEEHFATNFPTLHQAMLQQAPQGHTFWRNATGSMRQASKTFPLPSEVELQPSVDDGRGNLPNPDVELCFDAGADTPNPLLVTPLFNPTTDLLRKRQRRC